MRNDNSTHKISIADRNVHDIISEDFISHKSNNQHSESSSADNVIIKIDKFTNKETYYYKFVDKYFKNSNIQIIHQMIDIINKDSDISLRLLDWFVTRYSNKNDTSYKVHETDEYDFYVHISYKAQLKSYKKKYFDPFRRRKKFYYYYDKNNLSKRILTTIGQLNFFRWAFANNVIHYVEHNHKTIFKAMNKSNKGDKKRKLQKKKQKQKHTTKKHKTKTNKTVTVDDNKVNIFAKKNISDDEVKIILTFD